MTDRLPEVPNRALLLIKLEFELAEMQRQRKARRLVPRLLQEFRIPPHGVDLVCWLRDDPTGDNRDAVTEWVVWQLADTEFAADCASQPEYDLLRDRFGDLLSRLALDAANAEDYFHG